MRNAWLLTRNTLKIALRRKGSLIIVFILPVIGILFSLIAYAGVGTSSLKIGVNDRDHSVISSDMVHSLGNMNNFKIVPVGPQDMESALTAGKVDCVITIPAGFADSVYHQQIKPLDIASIKGAAATAWVQNYANVYIQNLHDLSVGSGGNKETFDKAYAAFGQGTLSLQVSQVQDKAQSKGVTAQSLGFFIMFMMLGAGTTAEMILREKRNRTYFRICSAPVRSRTYIFGNVAANMFIVIVQITLTLFLLTQVFHVKTYVPAAELFVILAAFGLVAIGLGLLLVAFSTDSVQASTMQTLIITPTCMLSGCFWPIGIMPKTIQRIADFLPQTWVIGGIQKLQSGSSFSEILSNLAVLLAFALVFFLVAAYRFSRSDDVRVTV